MRDDVKQLVEKALIEAAWTLGENDGLVQAVYLNEALRIIRQHFASSPASPDAVIDKLLEYAKSLREIKMACCSLKDDDFIRELDATVERAKTPKQFSAKGETVGDEETFTAVFNAISRLASMERGSSLGSLLSWQRKKLAEAAIAAMPKQESGWQAKCKHGTPSGIECAWCGIKIRDSKVVSNEIEGAHPPKPHASEEV